MQCTRQTVVITEASAGVGRATALAFAQRGWNVALLARDPGGLESTAGDVRQAGGDALKISVDVSDADAMCAAAEQIVQHWGAIDLWINNAMITVFGPVSHISPDEFCRVTEVTYLGCVFGTMAALKHMRGRDSGTIVQVGSTLSYRAIPLQAAYCGAKFAIRGFTDLNFSAKKAEYESQWFSCPPSKPAVQLGSQQNATASTTDAADPST